MQKALDKVDAQWKDFFSKEFAKEYMNDLKLFLDEQTAENKIIYPPAELWFNAFFQTPFEKIKIVIIGQDPYHGSGQANGLAFSVGQGVAVPPSLKNIFKEQQRDLNINLSQHGDLSSWAQQGVFLLNSVLSVEQGLAASHAKKGWEVFTQAAVEKINQQQNCVVFLAWGRHAHRVCESVDSAKHLLIKTSHPSPLGAYKNGKDFSAFLGSSCFSLANQYLKEKQQTTIDWALD